jgi:DNA-directed RNA polymerase subunit RPC12/RpoP
MYYSANWDKDLGKLTLVADRLEEAGYFGDANEVVRFFERPLAWDLEARRVLACGRCGAEVATVAELDEWEEEEKVSCAACGRSQPEFNAGV